MFFFDLDGTLIDSNGIWKDVDTAFLAKRGLPYTKEYYEGVAHTIFPLAARFTKEFCHLPESEEAIMAEWMDMAGDLYGTSVPVKPGVREYLEKLRQKQAALERNSKLLHRRLMKAFPTMKSLRANESLARLREALEKRRNGRKAKKQ